jgi:hypothetical protein
MSGGFSYTPEIWPTVISLIILVLLGWHGWRHRNMAGALPFSIACLFGFLWATGNLLEIAAVDLTAKIFWVQFQALWHLPSVTAVFFFVMEYTHPHRWLTRRMVILFSIVPLLGAFLILTNEMHNLMWTGFTFDGSIHEVPGNAYWILIVYIYLIGFANIVLFSGLFILSPPHRWPVGLMLIGQVGARIIYLLNAQEVEPFASTHSVFPIFTLSLFWRMQSPCLVSVFLILYVWRMPSHSGRCMKVCWY